MHATADDDTQWEVRTPLLHGSKFAASYPTEAEARAFAEDLAERKYHNAGLQIHTRQRIIYIEKLDD